MKKRFFSILWKINAILIFLFIAFQILHVTINLIPILIPKGDYYKNRSTVELLDQEDIAEGKTIEYHIGNVTHHNDVFIVEIKSTALILDYPESPPGVDGQVSYLIGKSINYKELSIINLLFISEQTGKRKLLFNGNCLIYDIRYSDFDKKTNKYYFSKNIYEIISQDINNDKKLDPSDRTDLYISDYNGNNLKLLIEDVISYYIYKDNQLIIRSNKNGDVVITLYDSESNTFKELINSNDIQ